MPSPLSCPRGRRNALRRRADSSVAAVSHGQHVLTPTAAAIWRANTAVSKAAWSPWPLTFWPWKWCPSHLWPGLPLLILVFLGLSVLDLGPMYATETSDVRQKHRLPIKLTSGSHPDDWLALCVLPSLKNLPVHCSWLT